MTRDRVIPEMSRTVHVIGDLHAGRTGAATRIAKLQTDLERHPYTPALRIQIGDQTESALSAEDTEYFAFRDAVDVDVELPGNHDGQGGARTLAQWMSTYGQGQNFTRDLGSFVCIGVSPDDFSSPYTLSSTTLDYLENALEATSKDCIIFCHYPLWGTALDTLSGEAQFRTNTSPDALFYIRPIDDVNAVLNSHSNAIAWVSGHTHTALDAVDVVKIHNVGDLDPDDYTDALATQDPITSSLAWGSSASTNASVTDCGLRVPSLDISGETNLVTGDSFAGGTSGGWANGASNVTVDTSTVTGGRAHRKFTATADGAYGRLANDSAHRPAVTAGNLYAYSATVDVVTKPANGQRAGIAFLDSGGTQIGSTYLGNAAESTGEFVSTVVAKAPVGATQCTILVGNFTNWSMADTEVSEFYVGAPDPKLADITGETVRLHLRALVSGGNATARAQLDNFAVTPGDHYLVSADLDVDSAGSVHGPAILCDFRTSGNSSLGYAYLSQETGIGSAGEGTFNRQILCKAPTGAAYLRVYVGNNSENLCVDTDVSDFDITALRVSNMGDVETSPPAGSRNIVAINASAVIAQGQTYDDYFHDEIVTLWITHTPTGLQLRYRNHGAGVWATRLNQRVMTVTT